MKKLKFILIPLLIISLIFPASSFAATLVTQEMVNHATINNHGNSNTVIIQNINTGEYYALGIYTDFNADTVTNGNWTYRTYKGVQGLTSPRLVRIKYSKVSFWRRCTTNAIE